MSREGTLIWSSFVIESAGIGSSDAVTITGSLSGGSITSMTIKAFGREVVLERAHLDALKGSSMNGVLLTYEHGYDQAGGRTMYVKMLSGFLSGVRASKVLVVNERGDVRVMASEEAG
jgi:hypothetical protein